MEVRDIKTVDTLSATLKEHSLVVLDFHAAWCGPCKAIMPAYMALASQFPDVVFTKINLDLADQRIVELFDVKSIPLFVVVHNNLVVDRFEGGGMPTIQNIVTKLTSLLPQAEDKP